MKAERDACADVDADKRLRRIHGVSSEHLTGLGAVSLPALARELPPSHHDHCLDVPLAAIGPVLASNP
jgi:hypothetical protein